MSNPKPTSQTSRRSFLQATAATTIAAGVWSELPAQESKSANDKLKILCIGTANRARADVDGVKSQDIVAVCDIDANYLDRAKMDFPSARTYRDYREMISAEADKADALVIATD